MAYILGFIMADGCILPKTNTLTIAIHKKDIEILHYINDILESTYPINYHETKTTPVAKLSINSKLIIEDLKKLGIDRNKTFRLNIPVDMPDKYFSHFIRGFFDGDGCISLKREKELHVDICSVNYQILKEMQEKCNNIGHIYNSKTSKGNTIYYWHMGQKDSWKFRDIIYNPKDVFGLSRKKELFYREFTHNKRAWRPEELDILMQNLEKPPKEIAKLTGRPYPSVTQKLRQIKQAA
jgi:intein/homing endonuclease